MKVVCTTSSATLAQVRKSRLFNNWAKRVHDWDISQVTVVDAFSWGGEVRMLLMRVTYGGYDHAILLRGSTVDILTIVSCDKRRYLVHVEQPRVAVGQVVLSNAAGMVDGDEHVAVAALRELAEELGVSLNWGKPLNLNRVVYGFDVPELGTPGGSDEDVTFFAVQVQVTSDDLAKLKDSVAGLAHEGEKTIVRLTEFYGKAAGVLSRLAANGRRPDMKASHSLLMFDQAMSLLNQLA